ncbi:Adenine specific DNA methylase Mod [Mycoplasmopsis arginini]|nr:Adenine specific DNA methylase Mod [Chlamydia abortus]SGA06974.1 Adenine specific DNA methylase Mod [Mycoplasmopsis arginini]SGA09945.1 Adenine specific DNA methylase Mod [Mycoplasmopsis arginini]SGA32110.1 Adenine specific DNA methylase Mod [Chlamydia abortus]
MHILNMHPNKNARVLDFYAGSGTTGHAVLELNRKDGGNRTFTLVTNNENSIGTNVCYERLYRINMGMGSKGGTNFE